MGIFTSCAGELRGIVAKTKAVIPNIRASPEDGRILKRFMWHSGRM
jgi:hypothetical protein